MHRAAPCRSVPVTSTLELMRSAVVCLGLAIAAMHLNAATCTNARQIAYEPNVVELNGTLTLVRARHPNGTWVTSPIIRLTQPVSVQADGVNPVNSAESCVAEVQLMANDPQLRASLLASHGKQRVVRGTLFHEHTAWHVRRLVMLVVEAHES